MEADPQATLNHLSGLDYRLLDILDYLSKCQGKHSKTGARYAKPSQSWLGKRFAVTRETICHHVRRLNLLGILKVQHRRKRAGNWQTNLYVVLKYPHWAMVRTDHMLRALGNRVKNTSLKLLLRKEKLKKDSDRPDPEQGVAFLKALRRSLGDVDP